jgi:hypothetical protein
MLLHTRLGSFAFLIPYETLQARGLSHRCPRTECNFSNRRFDFAAMLPRLGVAAVPTPPMPDRLLKLAEAHW